MQLKATRDNDAGVDVDLSANWGVVKDWSEESRYKFQDQVAVQAVRRHKRSRTWGYAMDQSALVDLQVDEGARLLGALRNQGFDVAVACWMKTSDDEQWYLYIASSHVERVGAKEAYRQLHTIIRSAGTPISLDPFELRLVGTSDPLVSAINDMRRRYRGTLPMRLGAGHFAGRTIDGGFVYPVS